MFFFVIIHKMIFVFINFSLCQDAQGTRKLIAHHVSFHLYIVGCIHLFLYHALSMAIIPHKKMEIIDNFFSHLFV